MGITLQFSERPYPGLRPFRYDESDIFFGRERQTDQLLARLASNRFLAVTGPSGCGKSSLIKAGMIPALQAGFMAEVGSRWRICQMRPGSRPFQHLAGALASPDILGVDRVGEDAAELLQATLRRGPLGLIEIVRGTEELRDATLLIVVDQFEEMFRYRERIAADEADAFVSLLLASVGQTEVPIYVVLTMRSDYLGDCIVFHGLPEAVSNSQYLTPRLTRDELALAIGGPARVFGGQVEPRLLNRLINDFGTDSDQLPLLQHALARLWIRCSVNSATPMLSVGDYEAIGGLAASLSLHGEEILNELTPEQRRIAEIMFRRLSGTEDHRRDVRSPAEIQEVAKIAAVDPTDVMVVAETFGRPDRCFLALPEGPLREGTVLDLSHESLIRQWDRLAGWAAAEAKSAEMYLRLRDWAGRWQEGGADLWRGPDLASALAWRQRENPGEVWAARYGDARQFQVAMEFLAASETAQRAAAATEEARRQRELRRTKRVALVLGLATASLASVFVGYLAAYVWDYDAYYKETVRVQGVPRGIGAALSDSERAHHSISYRITRHGRLGPVISMQLVNAQGQPRAMAGTLDALASRGDVIALQVSRWEFAYDEKNQLVSEVLLNRAGRRIQSTLYSPPNTEPDKVRSRDAYNIGGDGSLAPDRGSCAVFSRSEYSPEGYTRQIRYLDWDGKPTPAKNGAFIRETDYDPLGHIVRRTSLWKDAHPMNDDDGAAEARFKYDNAGNEIEEQLFDAAGQPIDMKKKGWQRFTCTYDDRGNCTKPLLWHADGSRVTSGTMNGVRQSACHSREILYDDRGNMAGGVCLMPDGQQSKSGLAVGKTKYDGDDRPIDDSYFDRAGHPVLGPLGGFRMGAAYDPDGNITELAYLDLDGNPMSGIEGYHKKISRFDKGHEVRTEYRDEGGRLTVGPDGGYAAVERTFDAHGNESRTTYIGIDDHPVFDRSKGYAIKTTAFDACGRETKSAFFDENERPVRSKEGYVHIRKTYDEANNVVEEAYLDERLQPIRSVDGYASVTREFDRNRNLIDERYFDEQDNALLTKDGFSEHVTRYNDHNALVEEAFLGAKGELVLNKKNGWAKRARRYDGNNGLIEETYFGAADEPALNADGYARATYVNDAHGHETEVAYFGLDGKPVIVKDGYARQISGRNAGGGVVEKSYLDAGGMPVLSGGGFARETTDLDEFGRVIGWAYFGIQNEPIIGTTERYHRAKVVLDDRGNRIESSLFGVDDKPLVTMEGWARRVNRYDARNVAIETSYYGADGEPVLIDDGYARITLLKDGHGRNVEESYFGTDGRLVKSGGFARLTTRYSEYGDPIEEAYFGVDGERVFVDERCARFTNTYDAHRHKVETACFDTNDEASSENPLNAVRVTFSYDKQGQLSERRLYLDGNLIEHQRMKDGNPIETSVTDAGGAPADGPNGYSHCQIGTEWQCLEHSGLPLIEAAEIVGIAAGSPAQQAQLHKGDLIISYNAGPVSALSAAVKQAAEAGEGPVDLVVLRDGSRQSIQVPRGVFGINIRKHFVP